MKNTNLIIIFFLFLFSNFFYSISNSKINTVIVVKVGKELITSTDIQNEILTNLIINNKNISQENIDKNKNFAIKNLINKSIKQGEIDRFKIKNYSKKDLQNYIESIAKKLDTDVSGLKKIFKQYNINYESFIKKYEIELLWNTLIFQFYSNQTNINIVEVENEIKKIQGNKNEEELKKIKENILNNKKNQKLDLFSRSHFSNLEDTVVINFL
jgi:hypothetical protein